LDHLSLLITAINYKIRILLFQFTDKNSNSYTCYVQPFLVPATCGFFFFWAEAVLGWRKIEGMHLEQQAG
jgi:hypothetical protein